MHISKRLAQGPLPGLDDLPGRAVPQDAPPVLDLHVHLFPDKLFRAIWGWLESYAWPVRYKLSSPDLLRYLLHKGLEKVTGLPYAHKIGVSRELNSYMAGLCAREPRLIGFATLYPGEEHQQEIFRQAVNSGLKGIKLHPHVQYFDLLCPEMQEIYTLCANQGLPLIIHAGREPRSPLYPYVQDPGWLCSAWKVEEILFNHPRLRLCVPHLGADEYLEYRRLLELYGNLWLDTSMALSGFLGQPDPPPLETYALDRIIYGSDFPNIPYAWDHELKIILNRKLNKEQLADVLARNALSFLNLNQANSAELVDKNNKKRD